MAIFSQNARLLFLLSVLCVLSLTSTVSAQKKCRALVLQGGGDKGAYEAGVLYGLVNNTNSPQEYQYDVVTGVSVGSINGLCIAQYEKGQELQAALDLVYFWGNVTKRDIYKPWKGGILEGLFFKPSLFNSSSEYTYLKSHVKGPPNKRMASIVATDSKTGRKVVFTEQYWGDNIEKALNAIMFSSAVPFIFIPQSDGVNTYFDGGWSGEGLDVEDAILRCRQIADNDEDIIVDVIFAGNITKVDVRKEGYTAMQMLGRYKNIHSYVSSNRTLAYAQGFYPEVNFRHVMVSSQKLPNQDVPLDFKAENIQFMINLGYKDARTELSKRGELKQSQ